jgi:hypothetical protein
MENFNCGEFAIISFAVSGMELAISDGYLMKIRQPGLSYFFSIG